MVRHLAGGDAAFAVDGPRGPVGVAKPGALLAARAANTELRPVATAASRTWVLHGTWDGFEIPLPFSRIVVAVGAPVDAESGDAAALSAAIHEARRTALGLVAPSGPAE